MGAWGFGLGTLSFASDYVDGGAYNDGGLGISLGLRLIPEFEIEGSYGHYTDSTLESSRNRLNRPIQLVDKCTLFQIQWSRHLSLVDMCGTISSLMTSTLPMAKIRLLSRKAGLGLALGAGVTFNIHQNIALELDGRLFQYNNLEYWDDAGDTATLVSMGVVVGFDQVSVMKANRILGLDVGTKTLVSPFVCSDWTFRTSIYITQAVCKKDTSVFYRNVRSKLSTMLLVCLFNLTEQRGVQLN